MAMTNWKLVEWVKMILNLICRRRGMRIGNNWEDESCGSPGGMVKMRLVRCAEGK